MNCAEVFDNIFRQPKHWQINFGLDEIFKVIVSNVQAPNLVSNCIAWLYLITPSCAQWILFENCGKISLFPMEINQKMHVSEIPMANWPLKINSFGTILLSQIY